MCREVFSFVVRIGIMVLGPFGISKFVNRAAAVNKVFPLFVTSQTYCSKAYLKSNHSP